MLSVSRGVRQTEPKGRARLLRADAPDARRAPPAPQPRARRGLPLPEPYAAPRARRPSRPTRQQPSPLCLRREPSLGTPWLELRMLAPARTGAPSPRPASGRGRLARLSPRRQLGRPRLARPTTAALLRARLRRARQRRLLLPPSPGRCEGWSPRPAPARSQRSPQHDRTPPRRCVVMVVNARMARPMRPSLEVMVVLLVDVRGSTKRGGEPSPPRSKGLDARSSAPSRHPASAPTTASVTDAAGFRRRGRKRYRLRIKPFGAQPPGASTVDRRCDLRGNVAP